MKTHSIDTPARKAFTLIELLTVIAIIGILAAILIPVVGKVREGGRAAVCRSNLREMNRAAYLYSQDHGQQFPHWETWYNRSPEGFREYIFEGSLQHTDGVSTIATCPTLQNMAPSWSVVTNTYAMNYRAGTRPGSTIPLPSWDAIREPSLMMHFMDGNFRLLGNGLNWYTSFVYHSSGAGHILDTSFPHGEKANVVYFDGHVGTLSREEADIVRRSNRDEYHGFWLGNSR